MPICSTPGRRRRACRRRWTRSIQLCDAIFAITEWMPRIFDNIEQQLLPALRQAIDLSDRSDFCVGYFNLRGWKQIVCNIERWNGGEGNCCRLLIGMQPLPQDELRDALSLVHPSNGLDLQTAPRLTN